MVVKDGKPEVATIVNVNCVIDHRYLFSGGAGKSLIPLFEHVFEHPEEYAEHKPSRPV